jgi:hypothetical protein
VFCQKLTVRHAFHITAFCITIYRTRWRLSSFKLSCNSFGIMSDVDRPSGIILVVWSCKWLVSSSIKSVYFCSFLVKVLWRLWLLGIAAYIKYSYLMVLWSKTMSGLLL